MRTGASSSNKSWSGTADRRTKGRSDGRGCTSDGGHWRQWSIRSRAIHAPSRKATRSFSRGSSRERQPITIHVPLPGAGRGERIQGSVSWLVPPRRRPGGRAGGTRTGRSPATADRHVPGRRSRLRVRRRRVPFPSRERFHGPPPHGSRLVSGGRCQRPAPQIHGGAGTRHPGPAPARGAVARHPGPEAVRRPRRRHDPQLRASAGSRRRPLPRPRLLTRRALLRLPEHAADGGSREPRLHCLQCGSPRRVERRPVSGRYGGHLRSGLARRGHGSGRRPGPRWSLQPRCRERAIAR